MYIWKYHDETPFLVQFNLYLKKTKKQKKISERLLHLHLDNTSQEMFR
jgi:hypothetical protein